MAGALTNIGTHMISEAVSGVKPRCQWSGVNDTPWSATSATTAPSYIPEDLSRSRTWPTKRSA